MLENCRVEYQYHVLKKDERGTHAPKNMVIQMRIVFLFASGGCAIVSGSEFEIILRNLTFLRYVATSCSCWGLWFMRLGCNLLKDSVWYSGYGVGVTGRLH